MSVMTETQAPAFEPLKIADRCDKKDCGAQAWVRTHKGGMILDFCKHHHEEQEINLIASGFELVEDKRSQINTQPSISANAV